MKNNYYQNVCIVCVSLPCMCDEHVGPWTLRSVRVEPPALCGH